MSRGQYAHTHIVSVGVNSTREVHNPDGRIRGYIMRIGLTTESGSRLSRPGYQPQDERRQPLTGYCDTFDRAMEWVLER
jgi:hypothetical protein